jgi:hypothetical protein
MLPLAAPAAVVDGQPNFNVWNNTGLYVWRVSGTNQYRARLVAGDGQHLFEGRFETPNYIDGVQRIDLEREDSVTRPDGRKLGVYMKAWRGGLDGVNFRVTNNGGLCLRAWNGAGPVRVGSGAVWQKPPVDLTGNGACGTDSGGGGSGGNWTSGRKYHPGHYVALLRKQDSQSIMAASVKPGVTGFVKRYTWRELEPTLGNYNFGGIASDLQFVQSQGMRLIILIEDKTFVWEKPTPGYLQGWEHTRPNRQGGFTAVRWHPYVVARMKRLHRALGGRFNSHPNFEGVATVESAPSLSNTVLNSTNYTPEKYRDALIEVLTDAANAMPNSRVFWFMNFFPRNQSYIAAVARAIAPLGGIMGGPDILPDSHSLKEMTYPFYDQFDNQMPLFGQVETECFAHLHKDSWYPTKYWTMPELFRFARDKLNVNYMFWMRQPNSAHYNSYNYFDTLPVIANNPNFNR